MPICASGVKCERDRFLVLCNRTDPRASRERRQHHVWAIVFGRSLTFLTD